MSRTIRMAGATLAAGITVGAAIAVAVPRHAPRSQAAARTAPTGDRFLAPAAPLTHAKPGPFETGRWGDRPTTELALKAGTLRTALTAKDPAGGPDWTVRTYRADRVVAGGPRGRHTVATSSCFQLGRIVDGAFGWIDGDDRFRPVSTRTMNGTPTQCGYRTIGTTHPPRVDARTLVDGPTSRTPRTRGSVVWGFSGARTRSLRLTIDGRSQSLTPARVAGAFLAFFPPETDVTGASVLARYAGGSSSSSQGPYRRRKSGPTVATARTFDPGGGPSWGVTAAKTPAGRWCLGQAGYLVDGHVGGLDPRLGTLTGFPVSINSGCGEPFAKDEPVRLTALGGGYWANRHLQPGRAQLRSQDGRMVLGGQLALGVRTVTISTARDVRTLAPSGPARAFIAVYDGMHLGSVTATARFADGHTVRQSFGTW